MAKTNPDISALQWAYRFPMVLVVVFSYHYQEMNIIYHPKQYEDRMPTRARIKFCNLFQATSIPWQRRGCYYHVILNLTLDKNTQNWRSRNLNNIKKYNHRPPTSEKCERIIRNDSNMVLCFHCKGSIDHKCSILENKVLKLYFPCMYFNESYIL